MRRKRRWLAALVLLALILSLPLLLNLDFLRQRVRRGLEQQLGRDVEVASLTGRLLPRPGVVGRQVRIFEQEGFGAEPFLYAEELRCDLPLRLLWSGRWHCSELHLFRPSINLVRNSDGIWNVGTFLTGEATRGQPSEGPVPPPTLSVSEGRLNFKLGVDKQVHALRNVRLRLLPREDGGWQFQLEAIPMRGDRRLTETGTVHVQGEIGRARDFFSLPFTFDARLDRGSLAQLVVLSTGDESPVRGRASFSATLEGSPAEWSARALLDVSDLRHRDLLASVRTPRWRAEFNLRVLERGQRVRIEKAALRSQQSEIEITGQVEDAQGEPQWDLQAHAERLEMSELLDQWASLKAGVPAGARLRGTARLDVRARGPGREWEGELSAPGGLSLNMAGLARPVEFVDFRLRLRRGRIELEPLTWQFSPEQQLTVAGQWRPLAANRPYRLHWQSEGVGLAPLQATARAFGWNLWAPTRWAGQARFDLEWRGETTADSRNRWLGQAELREASFHPPELNEPLPVLEARLRWRPRSFRIDPLVVRVGENPITGTLERVGGAGPWRAQLQAGELRLASLDKLLNPARRGLLARWVGSDSPRERRWEKLRVAGELVVEELVAAPFRLHRFEATGLFADQQLEFSRLRFQAWEGRFAGRFSANFRPQPPRYQLAGNLKQAQLEKLLAESTGLGALFTGMMGADLNLQTTGAQPDQLLRNLEGTVVGVVQDGAIGHIDLLAAMAAAAGVESNRTDGGRRKTELESLAGEFLVADQQVELEAVHLIMDGAALELSGRVRFGGGLNLRLSGEALQVAGRPVAPQTSRLLEATYQLRGSLQQPQLKLAEPLPPAEEPP